ncbi:DUF645 family protein, partial [Vibrio cholerae]
SQLLVLDVCLFHAFA